MVDALEVFAAWVPKKVFRPHCVASITRQDGAVDTISSDNLISFTIKKAVSDAVGTCELRITNPDGKYTDLYTGNEVIQIYMDYDNGTNKIFEGHLDRVKSGLSWSEGYYLQVEGRDYGRYLLDITANKEYINATISSIITDLITTYLPQAAGTSQYLTTNNVSSNSTVIPKINFAGKYLFDAIKEIADSVGWDFYVDSDKDLHFFDSTLVTSSKEAIVVADNLISCEKELYSGDIRNKIIVYGKDLEDVPTMRTKSDAVSIASFNTREKIFTDNNALSSQQVLMGANTKLLLAKDAVSEYGNAVAVGLPDLNPGDHIYIYCPKAGFDGLYKTYEYTHYYSSNGFITSVSIKKKNKDLSHFFKDTRNVEDNLRNITNKNGMLNSFNMTFEDSSQIQTLSNCEINVSTGGSLVLSAGQSSGSMISIQEIADNPVSSAELWVSGFDLLATQFFVSDDNGQSYTQFVGINDYSMVSLNGGTVLRIKIVPISNSSNINPEVKSLSLRHK